MSETYYCGELLRLGVATKHTESIIALRARTELKERYKATDTQISTLGSTIYLMRRGVAKKIESAHLERLSGR